MKGWAAALPFLLAGCANNPYASNGTTTDRTRTSS